MKFLCVFAVAFGLCQSAVAATYSIWNAASVPTVQSAADTLSVELGLRFRSTITGKVTGVRFYKGSANKGTHTGSLWSSAGARLAGGTFTNETAAGWQTLMFGQPVQIAANTVYTVSYHAPRGRYAGDHNYFNAPLVSGPLTALNGVYRYGPRAFPSQVYKNTNYWTDVIFVTDDTPPPPGGQVPLGYTLEWSDEFDTLSLGTRWAHYWTGFNVRQLSGNGDKAFKMRDEEAFNGGPTAGQALREIGLWGDRSRYLHEIVNGQLVLRGYPSPPALRISIWQQPFVASMISGQGTFARRYGYWETKVRFNTVSKGHHFAIWLLPSDNSWPPEIDMVEVVGQDQDKFHFCSHGAGAACVVKHLEPGVNISSDWHTFGFQWTPSAINGSSTAR